MIVIKNGKEFPYDRSKIKNAIVQSFNQIQYPDFKLINILVDEVEDLIWCKAIEEKIEVEDIQNFVISVLYREAPAAGRVYSQYRIHKEKAYQNPTPIEEVLFVSPEIEHENGNKNPYLTHIQNAYLAEIPGREFMREELPKDCLEAHDRGVVYFHDMAYAGRAMSNCCLLNLQELFKGCDINGVWIETPKSFKTACTVSTQILTHATSQQYGGITINLLHLAKFVDVSRQKIKRKYEKYNISEEVKEQLINDELHTEIHDGIQTFISNMLNKFQHSIKIITHIRNFNIRY